MALSDVSSKRPYLLRAMHEWMTDNGLTPHVVIDGDFPNADLPLEHLKDGRMVLNVSHQATRDLLLGNDFVEFEVRFSGRPRRLSIPIANVLGISARETGEWMLFAEENAEGGDDTPPPESGGRPKLRAVK
jgi:stringent starvation protein B